MTIEIRDLRIYCHHGVFDQEHTVGAWYAVTAVMQLPDLERPLADELGATINYAEAIELIKTVMSRPVRLIETAAEAIKAALTERFAQLTGVSVRVAKLLPPVAGVELAEVAVTVSSPLAQSQPKAPASPHQSIEL